MSKQIKISLLLLLISYLTGCSTSKATISPTPTSLLQISKVTIPYNNDPEIRGTLFGSGDLAVILVHMGNISNSQKDWANFARIAARENITVLTIDVPGFGKTPGDGNSSTFEKSVLAAVVYLENLGFDKIVCIGASAGGNACLSIAAQYPLAGLGVISSGLPISEFNYSALIMPKFFACTEDDTGGLFVHAQKEMYKNSPEPKELHIFQGDSHGTEILLSFFQKELTEKLMLFLNSIQ